MVRRTMYDVQSETVAPIKNLLDALVEVNAFAIAAGEAGWFVQFSVSENGDVDVTIQRQEPWPGVPAQEES